MSKSRHVAVIVGSLRKASVSRKMAHTLAEVAPPGLDLTIVEIGDLALYNEDLEASGPPRHGGSSASGLRRRTPCCS